MRAKQEIAENRRGIKGAPVVQIVLKDLGQLNLVETAVPLATKK
jgi:hypothetical protein